MERVMAKWWLGVALTVGGLAVAAPAPAQYLPPGGPAVPGYAAAGNLPPAPVPAGPPAGPYGAPPYAPVPPPPGEPCPPGVEPAGGGSIGGPNNAFPEPDCCPHCCYKECFHIDADYLLWYTRKRSLPALVTQGAPTDLAPGALGQPGTRTLLDGTGLDDTLHSGVRVTLAADLDQAQVWSVEASGFVLEDKPSTATFTGTGLPGTRVLARPFFDLDRGIESAAPFSAPGALAGSLSVGLDNRFYGADANVRYCYWRSAAYDGRVDVLVGGRFLALDEGLSFDEGVFGLAGSALPGSFMSSSESLRTTNRFYGGQVGLAYEGRAGDVFLNAVGKFAVGQNVQTLTNSATSSLTDAAGNVTTVPTGLLVQPSNAGRFTHSQTSFVPEVGLTLGYEFNKNLRLAAGYTLIVWTDVLRPEKQIDRTVSFSQAPDVFGNSRPGVTFKDTTFWAQGLSVSVQLSF
jgi:hypothetical protein